MVQFGFYALSAVMLSLVALVIKNHTTPRKSTAVYGLVCFVWIGYLFALSRSGFLDNFELPPRFPLLIVVPAVLGILFVTGQKSFAPILENTPLHWVVYLQSFRIVVELLNYGAFLEGVFPRRATFEGLNFDIFVGLSAPVAGALVQFGKMQPRQVLVWNGLSLAVLSVTVYAFISTYYFTDYLSGSRNQDFVRFPYLLLGSVLLPAAVFFHVVSIRQAMRAFRLKEQLR